jgi:hypothetical protein
VTGKGTTLKGKSSIPRLLVLSGLGLTLVLIPAMQSHAAGEELAPRELVQRHLKSIAPLDRLKERRVFAVQGKCEYRLLAGGVLTARGMAQLTSKGKAYNILFDFPAGEYGGTQYVTDGTRTNIAYTSGGQVNPLWIFLEGQDVLLREGLLGGELTTAWALLDVKGRKPRLKYRGIQEIDGRKVHRLDYRIRKGGGDLTCRLYFDAETYHHVLSTYEVKVSAPMGATPEESARQRVTRTRLEERFADFKDLDGYTLPTTWTVRYFRSTNDADINPLGSGLDPNVRGLLGGASTSPGPDLINKGAPTGGTILLQWKTTIARSAKNEVIPPGMLQKLLKID